MVNSRLENRQLGHVNMMEKSKSNYRDHKFLSFTLIYNKIGRNQLKIKYLVLNCFYICSLSK